VCFRMEGGHLGKFVSIANSTRFERWVLPAFAFKAVVIGGGYATGRELAEFFMPSGPKGGLFGMTLAAFVWSAIAALTFLFAFSRGSRDYRSFFRQLLGPAWFLFELAYVCMLLVVLSVFAAAAGEIGAAVLGWRSVTGTVVLMAGIAAVTSFGNHSVERLFKWVTIFLYVVYAIFLVLACTRFWNRIIFTYGQSWPDSGWIAGGLTYSAYNIVGAVIILPTLRHLASRRDAIISGLLCGPLAMLPAIAFFIAMTAFYPGIAQVTLPSDLMLQRLDQPFFHVVFQLMIFLALLESGTGFVHAINERLAQAARSSGRSFGRLARLLTAATILSLSIFVATRFGLVALISSGYRFVAYLMLALYVVPLLACGAWRLMSTRSIPAALEE
jgi:uncharacterized membrane protein YkvI